MMTLSRLGEALRRPGEHRLRPKTSAAPPAVCFSIIGFYVASIIFDESYGIESRINSFYSTAHFVRARFSPADKSVGSLAHPS